MKKKDKGAGKNTVLPLKPDQQVQELRSQSERVIRQQGALPPEDMKDLKPEERQKLLYELQVHQVELAMQNEELRTGQVNLEESRARYFELYDLAPVGYLTLSEQGFITMANLTVATLLGVERSALENMPLSRYILKEDQDIYYRHSKKLFESGEDQQCELRMVKADGVAFWAKLQGNLMQDEAGELQCRVVLSDITESKKAEEALEKSEKQLSDLLNNMTDAVWSISWPDFRHNYLNPSLEKLYGRSRQEIYDNPTLFKEITHPEDQHLTEKAIEQLLEKGQATRECRIIKPDGSIIWINDRSKLIYDENHQPIRVDGITRDITDRKQAEERLEQEQSEKELILNNLAEQVAFIDPQMRIIWANSKVIERHNLYDVDYKGQKCFEVYHQLDQPCPDCHALVAMETGETATGIHRSPDNSYWKMTCIPVRNQSGAIIGVMDTALEITDLITSRQKLQDNYTLLRLAGETARFGGWSVDLKTSIVTWSDQVAIIHEMPSGYSPPVEEGISFYAPEWREKISAVFTACAEEGIPYDEEMEIITAKGCRVWVRAIGEAVKDDQDNIVRIQGAIQDISDPKQAEAALKQSENRFQKMLGLIPDMISIHDPDMNIVYSNWRGFGDVPPEKRIINTKCYKTYRNYDQICPDCHAVQVLERKEAFESEAQITEGTWLDLRVIPLLGRDNEVEYFMEWVRDISDIKSIENEIRTLNKELEQRVKDRTIELEAVNKELAAFAYSISHDFRAPLRALNAFSANLTEKYSDQLDEQGLHYLNRISNAALYMNDLVDDLLSLSRITRTELKEQDVDISHLAEEILEELQEAEPERRVKVSVAPGLSAKGDSTLLKAALVNLIGNAWKFSSKEEQAEIEVGRMTINEQAFFVRDNGVGFNMAYTDKLFGAFQRLHGVDEFPGTGIGLATVQRIISRHGGRIWVESEVGKGATFYFTLKN